jgi:crotonobetainyl-CoA:carnitine CoA-transferase CaiB-like acyl-CoA transferase
MSDGGQLLMPLRVLDLSSGDADAVTRLLADLGADVVKVEPPGGSTARTALPTVGGVSVPFALHNANKRSIVLDPADDADRARFVDLAGAADIVVDSGTPGQGALFGASCAALAERFGHLVAVSVTDFGTQGPHASWRATDPVLYAMSTELSRSGPTTGTPVLPPDGIASATAAVQAAWAVLVAYYNRLRCGRGDYIDFSRFEAVLQALDPPFGSVGQAAAGQKAADVWRGRPKNQDVYPIFACKDGYVRICVLSPRQWHGIRAWLGEPEQFQDPKYDTLGARFTAAQEIGVLIAELFARETMNDLIAVGQSHGVPIAAVLSPAEVLASDHFRSVGALTDVALAPGVHVAVPVGSFVVNGQHAGLRTPAPPAGSAEPQWQAAMPVSTPAPPAAVGHRPFEGLRILDFGIIVAGGELGRLFADMGAEVIKVESAVYPDGLRQSRPGQPMSESFALTHRNEYGLGLDLRDRRGADIFGRLVAGADVVFANFKPGTLAALGFSYEALRSRNPGIILAESSAFGDSGPWSSRMGYGPLVRAATGVTRLWTSGDVAETARPGFYDAITIFPDHVVARITAIAALAALIRRDRAGVGAHVHISQAEAAVNQLDTRYVTEAARKSNLVVREDEQVHDVYPCAGDDEWCVISIRTDRDRATLATVMGCGGLPSQRTALRATVSAWTRTLDKGTVAELLQAAGLPAGPMNRANDVLDDPQVRLRRLFTDMVHPLFDCPMPSETGPAPYLHIPPSDLRPAPLPGEHTREICQKILAMDTEETERLIADGVLFATAEPADAQPRRSS